MDLKTARLTILIDPGKKQAFEQLCRTQDMTPSQVVRRLIREFMEEQAPPAAAGRPSARKAAAPAGKATAPRKNAAPRKPAAPRKAAAKGRSR